MKKCPLPFLHPLEEEEQEEEEEEEEAEEDDEEEEDAEDDDDEAIVVVYSLKMSGQKQDKNHKKRQSKFLQMANGGISRTGEEYPGPQNPRL